MTVPSTPRKAGPFPGNGLATSFPFTFPINAGDDVAVYLTRTDGVQVRLTTEYSIGVNPDQEAAPGGTVFYPSDVLAAPLAATEILNVVGDTTYEQPTSIANASTFPAAVVQYALDRLVMLVQQLLERMNRAISFAVGDTASTILPPAIQRARKALVFDVDGNATVSVDDYVDQLANVTAQANIATSAAAAANSSEGNALNSANSAADSAAAAAASIGSVDGSVHYSTTDAGPTWVIPVPFITFTGAFIGGLKYRPTAFTSDPTAGTVTLTAVPITDFEAGTLVDLHFVPA